MAYKYIREKYLIKWLINIFGKILTIAYNILIRKWLIKHYIGLYIIEYY